MDTTEKKIILENAIAYYVRQGYRVVSQTENTVQLIKPKQFSLLAAIILVLIYILPFVLYLLYYLAQKDKTVYIVVNDEGKISVTDESGQLRIVDNVEQIGISRAAFDFGQPLRQSAHVNNEPVSEEAGTLTPEETERTKIEQYGIEVVVCPSCNTINSLSFVECTKCFASLAKEKPISNPYLLNQ